MINAQEDLAKKEQVGEDIIELLEDSPRTKKALETYGKHLEKSRVDRELEFIDQRKAHRDKEERKA